MACFVSEEEPISLEIEDHIATITLDRGSRANAFDMHMIRSLHKVLQECSANRELRVVILRAEGDTWCAGGDVISMNETISIFITALEFYQSKNLDFVDCGLCARKDKFEIKSFAKKLTKCIHDEEK